MRPTRLLPIATATALLTLTLSASAAHASEDEGDPVAPGSTAAPPVAAPPAEATGPAEAAEGVNASAPEPTVKVEPTADDGQPKKVVKIVDGDDSVVIVQTQSTDDDDDDDELIEEEITEEHHQAPEITWLGLQGSVVFSPVGASGRVSSRDGRLQANQFKACADPSGSVACGYTKGMDFKVQFFESRGAWDLPRFVGYFRTGLTQGRAQIDAGESGPAPGQATQVDYAAVPLFLGGNAYLFDEFPVRPYAGLGFGFDVLRLHYRRAEQPRVVDASARIGFELHAGLEVRISNYIALHAEVMQLWSARRKLEHLPDYSNTGLSMLAGVTVGIPVRLGQRSGSKTVRRVRRVRQATP